MCPLESQARLHQKLKINENSKKHVLLMKNVISINLMKLVIDSIKIQ
jgi:hypothetical protein